MMETVMMINGGGGGEEEGNSSSSSGGVGGIELKRGTKRDASDSRLSDFERFEKRLRMLSLRNDAKRATTAASLVPIASPPKPITATTTTTSSFQDFTHRRPPPVEESMHIDDTSDRVYIHDLDAELAEDEHEEEEEHLIFLPDIEKKFSRIPQQVLNGRSESDSENKELVLYGVPASLTVDEEHDTVRRVIIEARQRAREKANALARQNMDDQEASAVKQNWSAETGAGYPRFLEAEDFDPDAMDIG